MCAHPYLDGIETIEFVYFVVSVVRVRLSVHCITTILSLQYVLTSPFFLFELDFVAAGTLFLLHMTVPVMVVPIRRSSVANTGIV